MQRLSRKASTTETVLSLRIMMVVVCAAGAWLCVCVESVRGVHGGLGHTMHA